MLFGFGVRPVKSLIIANSHNLVAYMPQKTTGLINDVPKMTKSYQTVLS